MINILRLLVRQMLKKVRIDDNGDTDMFPGSLIDMYEFADKNAQSSCRRKETSYW